MFRKLRTLAGFGSATAGGPYGSSSAARSTYARLFCDDLSAYRPAAGESPADWQGALFGGEQDPARVLALAQDGAAESRVRALAFHWLRAQGREVERGRVLGVVVEVPLDGGLDVLAAYDDGSVRYINQSGKIVFIEPGARADANSQAKRLIELARPVVARIGPWNKARRPPPAKPNVRLTFIVSDGLYFGEGPFEAMQRDSLSGPLLREAQQLLVLAVKMGTPQAGS